MVNQRNHHNYKSSLTNVMTLTNVQCECRIVREIKYKLNILTLHWVCCWRVSSLSFTLFNTDQQHNETNRCHQYLSTTGEDHPRRMEKVGTWHLLWGRRRAIGANGELRVELLSDGILLDWRWGGEWVLGSMAPLHPSTNYWQKLTRDLATLVNSYEVTTFKKDFQTIVWITIGVSKK